MGKMLTASQLDKLGCSEPAAQKSMACCISILAAVTPA
jgi:hypothetical protein